MLELVTACYDSSTSMLESVSRSSPLPESADSGDRPFGALSSEARPRCLSSLCSELRWRRLPSETTGLGVGYMTLPTGVPFARASFLARRDALK